MANGSDGPTGEMTETLWNTIKTKTWKDGGWKDGAITKWLYPAANGTDFKAWFNFAASSPRQLKLYMDQSMFNQLKLWTFSPQYKAWVDGQDNQYRLRWEYTSGKWKVFCFQL